MALFDKLFSTKIKLSEGIWESRDRARSCQITSEQVRLLLFKECDWRGRKVLFDSSTIQKVPAGKDDKPNFKHSDESSCILEVSNGFTYVYKGPAADASVLGEMIFGAVAMNYKGVSLKIHIMDQPRRLMCSKVFNLPSSRRISRVDRKTSDATSCGDVRSPSKVMTMPAKDDGFSLSFSLDRGDSGFYGDHSPHSSFSSTYDYFSMFDICDENGAQDDFYYFTSPPGRKLSTSSNSSWQRRTFHNMTTKFDLSSQSSHLLSVPSVKSYGTGSDSQLYSNSSRSDSLLTNGSVVSRKNKLGLALLITVTDSAEMDLVRRCLEHSPQLQALVCRLRLATLEAGTGRSFVATMHRAAIDAANWLSDLMYGPRIQPMWLDLVTCKEQRDVYKLADKLLSDMCYVLAVGDNKNTNFFISTLLTYVLTYHLGWVTTVSPYDTFDQKPPSDLTNEYKTPYNALWAQLNDLCGSIGFPPKIAKTVICCSKTNIQFINRLLVVITYFIRCGNVKRKDYNFHDSVLQEGKVISLNSDIRQDLKTEEVKSADNLKVPVINTPDSDSTATLKGSEASIKRTTTLANLSQKLSNSFEFPMDDCSSKSQTIGQMKRNPTVMLSLKSLNSSISSSSEEETEKNVVFVLGDDEKLVGLKNKSNGGKSVKKSSKIHNEPVNLEENTESNTKENCDRVEEKSTESPSKCCAQTLQHSKPIKHSGFKFEFDKYPQIVTNYMKSKNLEILDRHYIGKPGNLKLDNFQFDPTVVLPIQEERCETCYKCQLMESMLQTPTNASELEYMNDIPIQEPQYAKEVLVKPESIQVSPKTFVRKREDSTIVVNVSRCEDMKSGASLKSKIKNRGSLVKEVIEYPMAELSTSDASPVRSGFEASLLGGVTDHYVPDFILQGTTASPKNWEEDLRRDLELTMYLNKCAETPVPAIAIIGDTNTWEVRVCGRGAESGAGMSALVGGLLDALPAMSRARVPAHQCLSLIESKLREFCVLSKTLADMLMSTDFCDIATLTKSLNIDVNDVPLLLAIATTHTPQVATRYGISYR